MSLAHSLGLEDFWSTQTDTCRSPGPPLERSRKIISTDLKTDVRRKVVPRLHADDVQVSRSRESVFAAAGLLVAILGGPWTRADE
jgi:hypothetical protein